MAGRLHIYICKHPPSASVAHGFLLAKRVASRPIRILASLISLLPTRENGPRGRRKLQRPNKALSMVTRMHQNTGDDRSKPQLESGGSPPSSAPPIKIQAESSTSKCDNHCMIHRKGPLPPPSLWAASSPFADHFVRAPASLVSASSCAVRLLQCQLAAIGNRFFLRWKWAKEEQRLSIAWRLSLAEVIYFWTQLETWSWGFIIYWPKKVRPAVLQ